LPVGSTRIETKKPIESFASLRGSFVGRAAGTSTAAAYGFSEGSFCAATEGGSTMRMTDGFVAGVGSGAAGTGAATGALAAGTEVSGKVVAGSAACGEGAGGAGVGVGAGA
jgi:hypothetical protein